MRQEWILHTYAGEFAPDLEGKPRYIWVNIDSDGDFQVECEASSEGITSCYIPVKQLFDLYAAHETWKDSKK